MASGLLSLKWNNHRSTFFHVLSSIRSKESYCDATLACDGRFYPVHKLVLSTCSEYFEQIFERTQCKHPVIVLKDIKYEDLEALMNYMYVGEVNVLQEKLAGLIKAAECLKIKGLAVPDEDPLSSTKRNQTKGDIDSPHAKRRRRDENSSYEDRERHGSSRTTRSSGLSNRDHQQISKLESHSEISQLEQNSITEADLTDDHNQGVDSESDHADSDQSGHHRLKPRSSGSMNQRLTSQKPIPEVSIDETSVKTEPPDIQDDVEDSKEALHSNLVYDPLGDGESKGAGPESVASGSNEAPFSDSNMMDSTPQSVEDVVAQALPQSSNFQGNSFSLWEGEGSLQNFPGESFGGENSQRRSMIFLSESFEDGVKQSPKTSSQPAETLSNHESLVAAPSSSTLLDLFSQPPNDSEGQPTYSTKASFNQRQEKSLHHRPFFSSRKCVASKKFKPFQTMKQHVKQTRTYGNMMLFKCPHCSYETLRKQDLSYHFRTHTGEKPYACPFCSHKSSVMSNMKTHIRRRHAMGDLGQQK